MLVMVSFSSWVSSFESLSNKNLDKVGAAASLLAADKAPVVMSLPVA